MEPIINPWFFYFVDILSTLVIVCAILIVAYPLLVFLYCLHNDNDIDMKIKYFIPTLIFALIVIFTPSPNTMYKMLVASKITPNNIKMVEDTINQGLEKAEKISNNNLYMLSKIIVDTAKEMQNDNKNKK